MENGNKEMLFIVILFSHPDFRISDGLIACPIEFLKKFFPSILRLSLRPFKHMKWCFHDENWCVPPFYCLLSQSVEEYLYSVILNSCLAPILTSNRQHQRHMHTNMYVMYNESLGYNNLYIVPNQEVTTISIAIKMCRQGNIVKA